MPCSRRSRSSEADGDLGRSLCERYAGGLVQRVATYDGVSPDKDEERLRALARTVKMGNGA